MSISAFFVISDLLNAIHKRIRRVILPRGVVETMFLTNFSTHAVTNAMKQKHDGFTVFFWCPQQICKQFRRHALGWQNYFFFGVRMIASRLSAVERTEKLNEDLPALRRKNA